MSDDPISDDDIAKALDAILGATADLGDVLCLVHASLERDASLAPQTLIDAVSAKYETERDYANGGADQFVWNNGSASARRCGEAWRAAGAVENGDLLQQLADALDDYDREVGAEAIAKEPATHFLEYRRRVGGPFFGLPEPDDELAEALVEWAIEHAHDFVRAD